MCQDCGLPAFDSNAYQKIPLNRTVFSIRLIKLHPARTKEADIVLELAASDNGQFTYESISWCWGKSDWTRPIRVRFDDGDKCLKVSTNLESALRHLRLTDKFRILWVDAICIDQSNSSEKSRQVPMMSEIYGKAKSVCVWLGDEDTSTSKAISFMRDKLLNLQHFDDLCREDKHAEGWIALIQFMERPWVDITCYDTMKSSTKNMQFSRRWVIQEIALADQKTAMVVCGKYSISWADFVEAVSLFESALTGPLNLSNIKFPQLENVSYSIRYAPALGAIRLVKASHELLKSSYHRDKPVPLHSLEHLVSTFTMYETSEPRDVIFSLLSISKDAFRLDDPREDEVVTMNRTVFDHLPTASRVLRSWIEQHMGRRAFKVDYDAPVPQVYKQFISFSISKAAPTRALDIICRPWAPELKEFSFPSWICTIGKGSYKLVDQNSLGQRLVRRNPDPLVGAPDGLGYSASRDIGPSKELHIFKYWTSVDRSMFLRGFVLDQVGALEFPSQLGHIPSEWRTMGGWDHNCENPPEEFWRTLVADRSPDGRDPLPFYPRACKHVFQHAIDDTLDTSMLISHGSSIIADFLKRVQAVIWNRRLMRTKRGWLGLAPKGAQPDDLICILYGCSVPVVLRKVMKSEKDNEEEQQDEEARKANAIEYIARQIADFARRRRIARAKGRTTDQQDSHGISNHGAAPSQTPLTTNNANHPDLPSRLEMDHSRELKRHPSDSEIDRREPKRTATLPGPSRKIDYGKPKPFYYALVGECYVHGVMNGEAISFRIRDNAGKSLHDRVLPQTFELR